MARYPTLPKNIGNRNNMSVVNPNIITTVVKFEYNHSRFILI